MVPKLDRIPESEPRWMWEIGGATLSLPPLGYLVLRWHCWANYYVGKLASRNEFASQKIVALTGTIILVWVSCLQPCDARGQFTDKLVE